MAGDYFRGVLLCSCYCFSGPLMNSPCMTSVAAIADPSIIDCVGGRPMCNNPCGIVNIVSGINVRM